MVQAQKEIERMSGWQINLQRGTVKDQHKSTGLERQTEGKRQIQRVCMSVCEEAFPLFLCLLRFEIHVPHRLEEIPPLCYC